MEAWIDIKKYENKKEDGTLLYTLEASEGNYFYQDGMQERNEKVWDMEQYPCLVLEAWSEEDAQVCISLDIVKNRSPKPEKHAAYQTTLGLAKGTNRVCILADQFDLAQSQSYYLRFVRGICIKSTCGLSVETLRLQMGSRIAVRAKFLSKAVSDGDAVYPADIWNCTPERVRVRIGYKPYGWQAMEASADTAELLLEPGTHATVQLRVKMSERVAPGGYEKQDFFFIPDGQGQETVWLKLWTVHPLPYPHVWADKKELEKAIEKMKTVPWAARQSASLRERSDRWEPPVIDTDKPYLFETHHAHDARGAAYLYALMGEDAYAQKALCFLRELSDPEKGYLRLPCACNQELVHEGEFFKSAAAAYDMIYDFEALTQTDHARIDAVLYRAVRLFDGQLKKGEISNWTLAELCGGLYCACALQDMYWIQRFLYGTGGAAEHLSKGTLGDGWWYEASIGYNLLSAGLFSEISHIVSHFGINFKDIQVPASYAKSVFGAEALKDGLVMENWGPGGGSSRGIKMLWDSLLPFYDYRGVIFGINDSTETRACGCSRDFNPRYDIAYYLYGDARYAQLLKQVPEESRDLLFGAETLPEACPDEEKTWSKNACADNAGVIVLRSRTPGRSPREQIQVGLKYGSHGGAHGHYDRVSMTSLMRYGRSLTNPENVWYSYHTLMYKFYVQNSINHNMVTADLKQQDPSEPERLLFYSGKMMQAAALSNTGRWCNPPYGGWPVDNQASLKDRCWAEGRYVPIPDDPPEYAVRTDFTEEILTRRLTVVTDDFVVHFDYAKGETEHTYQCITHLQGLRGIEGVQETGHTEQLSEDPLGSAQFITDCTHYHLKGTAKLRFAAEYTEMENNGGRWLDYNRTDCNEPGRLETDLYLAYPPDASLVIGSDPQYQGVNKQLWYRITDGCHTLTDGKFGAWILGKKKVELDIEGTDCLKLYTKVRQVMFEEGTYAPMEKSIFWGNLQIELMDGTVLKAGDLSPVYENICPNYHGSFRPGIDYGQGEVKIQGEKMPDALAAEPLDQDQEGVITINLRGLKAKRFSACIGSDYPVGNESRQRKCVVLEARGREASFITLLEPAEQEHVVLWAEAAGENEVHVGLRDGRQVWISVQGLKDTQHPSAAIVEKKDGAVLRHENTE